MANFYRGEIVKVQGYHFLHFPFARCLIDDEFEEHYLGTVLQAGELTTWSQLLQLTPRIQISFILNGTRIPMWFEPWMVQKL